MKDRRDRGVPLVHVISYVTGPHQGSFSPGLSVWTGMGGGMGGGRTKALK